MSSPELNAAAAAALAAGQLMRDRFRQRRQVQMKGPANLVTEVDLLCEQMIVERLQSAFPQYGVLGEEGSLSGADGRPRWVIDPLDGTTNYAHGYPHFAVSIALVSGASARVGVVYQPLLDELFTAEAGQGAFLNGERLHVSAVETLDLALVASGFPYDMWDNPVDNTAEWARLVKRVQSPRCDGVAAVDLCYVAAGRLDAYWELDLEPWDMAAGALVCQEAGGRVTLVDGAEFDPMRRSVLATNGPLHEPMLALLRGE